MMAKAEAAANVFQRAFRFYTKYAYGNMQNEIYWHNMAAEADELVKECPCGLMQDIVQAVLSELVRERKGDDYDALYQNNTR